MRSPLRWLGVTAGLLSFSLLSAAHAYRPVALLCRFQDPAIAESSGLAASARSDAYFFTHNDSGDGPNLYAVDRRGRTLATFSIAGAQANDWEDMARGPGAGGAPALYLGDIGDNFGLRSAIDVYRVPEPAVDTTRTGVKTRLSGAVRFRLRYEDGAHNAETLMVQPGTGKLFILTKSERGSGLYTADGPLQTGQVNVLHRVGAVNFAKLRRPAGAPAPGHSGLLATGGDISPDGKRMAVCTYETAWEWPISNGDIAAALKAAPAWLPVHEQKQREGICYSRDGRSLFTSSEGGRGSVYQLGAD